MIGTLEYIVLGGLTFVLLVLSILSGRLGGMREWHDNLSDMKRRMIDDLFYFAVFFPTVYVVSQVLGFLGYNIRFGETIIMSIIVSISWVVADEIRESVRA